MRWRVNTRPKGLTLSAGRELAFGASCNFSTTSLATGYSIPVQPANAKKSCRAAAERNTKHQSSSSREVPNLKHQTSKTDAGANGAQVGFLSLEFGASLEFGIWSLSPGLSAAQKLSAPEAPTHHQVKLTSGGMPIQLSSSFGNRKFSTWLSPKSMFS